LAFIGLCLFTWQAQGAEALLGKWRFTLAVDAPWSKPAKGLPPWHGKILNLTPQAMRGPQPLHCGNVRYENTQYPAAGLFQGNLPAPADKAAQSLGIARLPVSGLRVTCDAGVFELHQVDADTLLLALDNRIWTLSRAPGALAITATPEGRVESFLEKHFSGDMGFDAASVKRMQVFFSKQLLEDMRNYFAKPQKPDEVPVINGDPFTNSQEYPTRFAVGKSSLKGAMASVPVRFADAFREYVLTYELHPEHGAWRIQDVRDDKGESLHKLLQ